MNFHKTATITLLFLVFIFSSCCCCNWSWSNPKVWITEEEDHTLSAEELDSLAVETYNGDITVTASQEFKEIRIHVTKKAGGEDELDAAECMKAFEIVNDVRGETLELHWKWDKEKKELHKHWGNCVSFEIHLPARLEVSAVTYNGDVALAGTSAGTRIETYNGTVMVTDQSGDLEVQTYNGDIRIGSETTQVKIITYNGEIQGDLESVPTLSGHVESYNGDIALRIHGEPSTRFDCDTYNGAIRPGQKMKVQHVKRRRLEGTMGAGEGKMHLETYNGDITIE